MNIQQAMERRQVWDTCGGSLYSLPEASFIKQQADGLGNRLHQTFVCTVTDMLSQTVSSSLPTFVSHESRLFVAAPSYFPRMANSFSLCKFRQLLCFRICTGSLTSSPIQRVIKRTAVRCLTHPPATVAFPSSTRMPARNPSQVNTV